MSEVNAPPPPPARPAAATRAAEAVDLAEQGKNAAGKTVRLDRRLFLQLQAFTDCFDTAPLVAALEDSGLAGVLYQDVRDPYGVGLLTFDEDPEHFVGPVRELLLRPAFRALRRLPEMTMLGRTYSIGYEQDLEHVLLERPVRRVTDPAWPWAIWYPLRRAGAFEQLEPGEQRKVLMEHGGIGRAYGEADHGHDVRLSCHGLDRDDNDFIAGLVGARLHPLSHIVQRMRRTRQTSRYLEKLGPFFVGRALWQRAPGEPARRAPAPAGADGAAS